MLHTHFYSCHFDSQSQVCTLWVEKENVSVLREYTRWFKYGRDWLCVNKSQFVPVIFEPPLSSAFKQFKFQTVTKLFKKFLVLLKPKGDINHLSGRLYKKEVRKKSEVLMN
jgi:hypothetical protein